MKTLAIAVVVLLTSTVLAAQKLSSTRLGPLGWDDGFGLRGVTGTTRAFAVYDEGDGPELYVGGTFAAAGEAGVQNLARWTGAGWQEVGSGWNFPDVNALVVYDDGYGDKLYAATGNGLYIWDGSTVVVVPIADGGTGVAGTALFSDSEFLYFGGRFAAVGGVPAENIARYDGERWYAMGTGLPAQVEAIERSRALGPPLLFAGSWGNIGGLDTLHYYSEGDGWIPVAGSTDYIWALEAIDDANGARLLIGGNARLASLDTNGLQVVDPQAPAGVRALQAVDEGGQTAVYMGGSFTSAGGLGVEGLVRWDGSTWSPLGTPALGSPLTVTVYGLLWTDIDGDALLEGYVGGQFDSAGNVAAKSVAMWDGGTWSPLGDGQGIEGAVNAIATFDAGGGPALYFGGSFARAGDVDVTSLARWEGGAWAPVAGNPLAAGVQVRSLHVWDDGSGPALYVAGTLDNTYRGVARWDGTSWTALGGGLTSGGGAAATVWELDDWDDGGGPALYAVGQFDKAGGLPAVGIARWDGASWGAIGSIPNLPMALEVWDDGGGEKLYVGGYFPSAGGVATSGLASWDGASWADVGGGVFNQVRGLRAVDLPELGGSRLALTGSFSLVAGTTIPAAGTALWDGSEFTVPPTPAAGGLIGSELVVFDDGAGPRLYVIGVSGVKRLDPSGWVDLGVALGTQLQTGFVSHLDPDEPSLWIGGWGALPLESRVGASGATRWFRRREPLRITTLAPTTSARLGSGAARPPHIAASWDPADDSVEVNVGGVGAGVLVVGRELVHAHRPRTHRIVRPDRWRAFVATDGSARLRERFPVELAGATLYAQAFLFDLGANEPSAVLRIDSTHGD